MGPYMNGRAATAPLSPAIRRHHKRTASMPFEVSSRKKPRRWPLALRFIKGAIHHKIIVPILCHGLFTAGVVALNQYTGGRVGLPPSIVPSLIPSLSIVVGLMLVFRNQTSYSRFWDGRNHLSTIITSVRNLTRSFVTSSYSRNNHGDKPSRAAEHADTERAVKNLLAILFATRNHLRADWGAFSDLSPQGHRMAFTELSADFEDLRPHGMVGYSHKGLGVTLQFCALVESYIQRGVGRGWWAPPQASQLTSQVNAIVEAYGRMETIRLTPVPVAHLIHQKQVLALFGAVIPFAMVRTMGWFAIPITLLVIFTLYGIDVIASELEDPFGYDRNDIPMDAVVEDIRAETFVMVDEWKKACIGEGIDGHGEEGSEWFVGDRHRVRFQSVVEA